ncbi:MAG: FG-GAP repeat protein [Nannocystaceae bacterium]|nr:FG-GAP repeat protein [Nannocystaceae bacterium]
MTDIQRGHYIGEFQEGGLGCAVAAVGDVGGLGHDGLLVGAYQASSGPGQLPPIVGGPSFKDDPPSLPAAGAAYLLYEPPSEINYRIRSAADAVFIGEHEIHNAGFAVGGRGDYNRDGHDDILLGAPGQFCTQNALHGGPGATYCDVELPPESVHMFLGGGNPGKTPAHRLEGLYIVNEADLSVYASHPDPEVAPNSTPHSTFGMSVAWTNSMGRPGIDDFIIGAPKLNRAYLVYGSDDALTPVMTTESAAAVMYLGDHADEHAVTAQHVPTSHVLYGADAAGRVVAGGGDIDGDGIEDVAVSAPGQLWFRSGPTSLAGRVFVMPGSRPEQE